MGGVDELCKLEKRLEIIIFKSNKSKCQSVNEEISHCWKFNGQSLDRWPELNVALGNMLFLQKKIHGEV